LHYMGTACLIAGYKQTTNIHRLHVIRFMERSFGTKSFGCDLHQQRSDHSCAEGSFCVT